MEELSESDLIIEVHEGMMVACRSNKNSHLGVRFDPKFLEKEAKRKEEKKVRYTCTVLLTLRVSSLSLLIVCFPQEPSAAMFRLLSSLLLLSIFWFHRSC